MKQPLGFVRPDYPNHVFRLCKALYGLKQVPRAWYQRFVIYILSLGFTNSRLLTLFLPFIVVGRPSISFLYVDDISLTASTTALITKVISLLSAEFAITNLGPLSFFSALLLLVPLKVCFSHKLLSPKSSCPVPT